MLADTSFLIDAFSGRSEAADLAKAIDEEGGQLRIPTPVLFELVRGAAGAKGRKGELQRLEEQLQSYETVAFEAEDARSAGILQEKLARSGRELGTIDVQLAGMAIARNEELVTGDRLLAGIGHGVPVRTYRRA
jgi:predicted nucleic acid-binding protein